MTEEASRLTFAALNYAPEPTGNAPYTTALASHLGSKGSDVTVLTTFPHYPQWRRYVGYSGWRSETRSQRVRLIRLRHWVPNPPRGLRRLVSELTFGLHLACSNWRRPHAVVMVSPALFSSWLAMVRLTFQRGPRRIVWVQDLYSQGMHETGEGGGFAQRIASAIEGWTLGRAHAVVAIHETMAARMSKVLGVDPDRITVIPNWSHVEPVDLSPAEAKAQLGWAPRFTALHAGNMGLKQGLDVVIHAAREATARGLDLTFVLLGDGGERRRLEGLATGLDNVTFVDPVAQPSFPVALAAADVLLVTEAPGVAEMAAPSKLTSYFSADRPVVASVAPSGIVSRIMSDSGAGPVVHGGDAGRLLDAIEDLQRDAIARARAASNAGRYWRRNLGPDHALASWEQLLTRTILARATRGESE